MNKAAKHLAHKTLLDNKRYSALTYQDLQEFIEEKGFQIVPYKKYNNSSEIDECITRLCLQDKIQQHDSFIYLHNNLKLVFINDDLSTQDKRALLCHELGHIVDIHFLSDDLSYSKIQSEEFANEFSYHLQNPGFFVKLLSLLSLKSVIITLLTISVFFIGGIGLYQAYNHSHTPTTSAEMSDSKTEYFVTSSGKKYHKGFCIIVKYRNNVTAYSLEELINNGYEPCQLCIGE